MAGPAQLHHARRTDGVGQRLQITEIFIGGVYRARRGDMGLEPGLQPVARLGPRWPHHLASIAEAPLRTKVRL